ERRLLRVLHREPAVIAVARVRVDVETQFVDVERKRLVLVAHVQADHTHTNVLAHGTSFVRAVFIPSASRLRFSETAVLRSGRWAARTAHSGTRSASGTAGRSRARSSPGLSPVMSRNTRPNVPRLFQPVR